MCVSVCVCDRWGGWGCAHMCLGESRCCHNMQTARPGQRETGRLRKSCHIESVFRASEDCVLPHPLLRQHTPTAKVTVPPTPQTARLLDQNQVISVESPQAVDCLLKESKSTQRLTLMKVDGPPEVITTSPSFICHKGSQRHFTCLVLV